MEDFQAAYLERVKDVVILDAAGRHRAAMHLGGIAIECLLKAIICTSFPKGINEWKADDSTPGPGVINPGHSYQKALNSARKYNRRLQLMVQRTPSVIQLLQDVETPDLHFISMRYSGFEPDPEVYKRWYTSYKKLLHLLIRQLS